MKCGNLSGKVETMIQDKGHVRVMMAIKSLLKLRSIENEDYLVEKFAK